MIEIHWLKNKIKTLINLGISYFLQLFIHLLANKIKALNNLEITDFLQLFIHDIAALTFYKCSQKERVMAL